MHFAMCKLAALGFLPDSAPRWTTMSAWMLGLTEVNSSPSIDVIESCFGICNLSIRKCCFQYSFVDQLFISPTEAGTNAKIYTNAPTL
jgi:hypothetical protein